MENHWVFSRMPCTYVIHKEQRLVISDGHGCLTVEEMTAHDDRLRNDPDFEPDFNQLVDGTKISSIEGAAEQIRLVAGRLSFFSAFPASFRGESRFHLWSATDAHDLR